MAKEFNANVILGFGGGSSMDSAKAIAVEATHEGTSWDYLFYRDTQPSEKTLPVITVSTTSGTGAHVTQVAVITNEKDRDKSAIYNNNVIPKVSIVDPELMLSVPQNVTSATGFDVFCHAFESTLHPNSSLYTELMAFEAIDLVNKKNYKVNSFHAKSCDKIGDDLVPFLISESISRLVVATTLTSTSTSFDPPIGVTLLS